MTPRERWDAIMNGRAADRTPTDISGTSEIMAKLREHLGVDDDEAVSRRLGVDSRCHVGPLRREGCPVGTGGLWGVENQSVDHGTGAYDEVSHSPLADAACAADVHRHDWPDPDAFDYTTIADAIRENDGYRYVTSGFYQPYLHLCDIRGLEQAMMDFAVNPDILDAILGHLFDFCHEYNRRCFEAGPIDMMYMSSDLGSQHGPLMSVAHYRRFIMPGHVKMAELAHSHGVKVFFHSDGAIGPFIPVLIDEVGIDLLNPIQWRCHGMERETLAKTIGDRVVLHGAIDNQHTLPFGTPDDVRREVRQTRDIFADCRWVCAPCHNLQSNTPVENVLAMYDALRD